ncbi:MAG: NAD-dependent epimerase/dehydratase family protein [Geobacteraceae bacterium]|nr:NAD-dependent epimerase/dehydratase family protein [Geobacteraceae bacterium]
MRVAILGATSHIAKSLILEFHKTGECELYLFARSLNSVQSFLESIGAANSLLIKIKSFSEFSDNDYEAVINCVGIGNKATLANEFSSIFNITEMFDDLVLTYLQKHQQTYYINFSSGAAYGVDFSVPVDVTSQSKFNLNSIADSEYYGIAKINSEAKHRVFKQLNIIDLRVFGYFSRFIDLNDKYLLSDIINCLKNNLVFVTGPGTIVRDFVHPQDLFSLIKACLKVNQINDVFDVYSARPATKFEIIDHFVLHHGLKYSVETSYVALNVTGAKDCYYSNNFKASSIGYEPKFSSMDGIKEEIKFLL